MKQRNALGQFAKNIAEIVKQTGKVTAARNKAAKQSTKPTPTKPAQSKPAPKTPTQSKRDLKQAENRQKVQFDFREMPIRQRKTFAGMLSQLEKNKPKIDAFKSADEYWYASIYGNNTKIPFRSIDDLAEYLNKYATVHGKEQGELFDNIGFFKYRPGPEAIDPEDPEDTEAGIIHYIKQNQQLDAEAKAYEKETLKRARTLRGRKVKKLIPDVIESTPKRRQNKTQRLVNMISDLSDIAIAQKKEAAKYKREINKIKKQMAELQKQFVTLPKKSAPKKATKKTAAKKSAPKKSAPKKAAKKATKKKP